MGARLMLDSLQRRYDKRDELDNFTFCDRQLLPPTSSPKPTDVLPSCCYFCYIFYEKNKNKSVRLCP